MRTKVVDLVVGIMIILSLSWSLAVAQNGSATVFVHANVIPMNREIVLSDYSVIVEDGTITQLGPSSAIPVPEDATVIDASGKFMIPALSDMHVHLEGDPWNIMFPPGAKFTPEEINYDDILFLYVAKGITTIEVMSAFPEHILLREKIKRNEMIGPRMILGRMIDGAGKAWPPPLCTWVNNPDEARKAVLDMHDQGYDRVKVYSFLDKASYDTIVATAKRLGMPVDGHVPLSTSVEHVVSSGQNMIAHPEELMKFAKGFTLEQVSYYASLVSKGNTWMTSTLTIHRNLNALLRDSSSEFSKPGVEYLHPMGRGIWEYIYTHLYRPIDAAGRARLLDGFNAFQKPFVYEFWKQGGKLLIGTDPLMPTTLPAFALHDELCEVVSAGLPPYAALRAATTNVSEFLGELDRAGTIEPGKRADVLLLDDNPLQDIANTKKIAGVMTQNRWISRKDIDKRLNEIRESYATLRERKTE